MCACALNAFVHLNSLAVSLCVSRCFFFFLFSCMAWQKRIFLWSKRTNCFSFFFSLKPYLPFCLIVDIRHFFPLLTANSPYSVALSVVFVKLIKTDYSLLLELYHHCIDIKKKRICLHRTCLKVQQHFVLWPLIVSDTYYGIVSFMNINCCVASIMRLDNTNP